MRKTMLLAAATLMLAACSPPASQTPASTPSAPPPPVVTGCNDLVPDPAKLVSISGEAAGVASLPPELPGGPITPGDYDLVSAQQLGGPPAWTDPRAVALRVSETDAGVVFDWASSAEGDRWSASFHQGPPAQMVFSCGRVGDAEISFAASATDLQLRAPTPSGDGALVLRFAKRL